MCQSPGLGELTVHLLPTLVSDVTLVAWEQPWSIYTMEINAHWEAALEAALFLLQSW